MPFPGFPESGKKRGASGRIARANGWRFFRKVRFLQPEGLSGRLGERRYRLPLSAQATHRVLCVWRMETKPPACRHHLTVRPGIPAAPGKARRPATPCLEWS